MKNKPGVITAIWDENARNDNPFYPEENRCRGYDFYGELLGRVSWHGLLYLHMRGDLPGEKEDGYFNLLMSAVMNPGPRDPQNQAAMSAAVGGCPVGGSLMAGFGTSQGDREGGGSVEACMSLLEALKENREITDPAVLADRFRIMGELPGFGLWYGEKDHRAARLSELIREKGYGDSQLAVLESLGENLRLHGVFAAGLSELGFSPKQGHGLYMLSGGGGMLAFLCEQYERHWTEFPHWFGYGEYNYEP